MSTLQSLVVGGVLGFLSSFLLRLWLVHINENTKRFEELCKYIEDAADEASDYWFRGPRDDDLEIKEAKIIGLQTKILLTLSILQENIWYLEGKCSEEISEFLDGLSGGSFQVKFREADVARSIQVQQAAAHLITRLRQERGFLLKAQIR